MKSGVYVPRRIARSVIGRKNLIQFSDSPWNALSALTNQIFIISTSSPRKITLKMTKTPKMTILEKNRCVRTGFANLYATASERELLSGNHPKGNSNCVNHGTVSIDGRSPSYIISKYIPGK